MIVNNLSDKVHIIFSEGEVLEGATYTIQGKNFNGTGDIIDGALEIQLPDGSYKIIVNNGEYEDYKECFTVFYNGLPLIVDLIRKILCPCGNCKKTTDEDLLKALYELTGFFQNAKLLCSSYTFNRELNKGFRQILEQKEYEAYYGEFKFDYRTSVRDLLAYAYVELYLMSSNALNLSEKELDNVNNLYKVDSLEKCLYRLGYNLEDIICSIEKQDCHGM